MAEVRKSIEVDAPVSTAYNQWTQFEEFPRFMEGVESVTQIDDTHLRWAADVGGNRQEWQAEIVEQVPDQVIAWRSLEGKGVDGAVRFEPVGAERTRVDVNFTWDPDSVVESLGSALGMDDRRVKGDLDRFKELVERRGVESGAWRGEVHSGERTD